MINFEVLKLNNEKLKHLFKDKLENYDLIEELKILNVNYKKFLRNFEVLKHKQKKISNQIKNTSNDYEIKLIKQQAQNLKQQINTVHHDCLKLKDKLFQQALFIPNFPDENVPTGKNDQVLKKVGIKKKVKFSYLTIIQNYGLIDWERTAILSGSRFVSYLDVGARLRRAFINFMLDFHSARGFFEISTPLLVNPSAVLGTGNLPKFKNDLYQTVTGKYLIPTSEVTLTNFFAGKIFQTGDLPIRLTQFSHCFRKEAGAAGQFNRGLMRLHEFNKVEIVKITHPEQSAVELKNMVFSVEQMLNQLKIPYQIKLLAAKNLGFAAAKTFDLEVWMPSENQYREISSCSNCKDFQARRINLKFKNKNGQTEFLHTLNGSGLAIDRLFAAALENWQTTSGKIKIPKALRKFFPHKTLI